MQTGDLKNVQPGYDDKNKEMPEQKPNSDMRLGEYAQSPDCTNANVVGLPSSSVNDFFQSGNIYYKSSPNHSLKSQKLTFHVEASC
jgi:hypothetical protein